VSRGRPSEVCLPPVEKFRMPGKSHRHRLELMMRCAKALAIGKVEWMTTIIQLNDVVGIHTVVWCCLDATVMIVIYPFTSTTSTVDDVGTPGLELRRVVDRRLDLGRKADRRAYRAQAWR